MKKKVLALFLVLAMVMSLAACGSSDSSSSSESTESSEEGEASGEGEASPDGDEETAAAEDTISQSLKDTANIDNSVTRDSLIVAWNSNTKIDPWGTDNATPGNYEVYEMLYETSSDGEFYALLADDSRGEYGGYDHEDGSNEYKVYIHDNIYDHEGEHITASDVAYSYKYQYDNATTSGWDEYISGAGDDWVTAEDDTTVVFKFSEEMNALGRWTEFLSRCFIVSENCTKNLNSEMCGTGPYKFKSYTSGSTIVIEKNDDYWQGFENARQEQQANVQEITYQFSDEGSSRETGLQSGALDMSFEQPSNNLAPFQEGGAYSDQYKVFTYAQKFCYYLCANVHEESQCSDLNLRLAIFNAIDQNGVIAALGNIYNRSYAFVSDYYSDYNFVDWSSLDNYNTKAAVDESVVKDYLDQSSYDGSTITILCQSSQNDATTVIAAQLAAVGINASVSGLDEASFNSSMTDPNTYDLVFGMMAGDYNVQVWDHCFNWDSNNADGTATVFGNDDQEWKDMLTECNTEEGHTPENMEKWWDYCVENAQAMGIYTGNDWDIVPADCVYVCQGDKLTLLPGACCFDGSK